MTYLQEILRIGIHTDAPLAQPLCNRLLVRSTCCRGKGYTLYNKGITLAYPGKTYGLIPFGIFLTPSSHYVATGGYTQVTPLA